MEEKVNALQTAVASNNVDHALESVRRLANRPRALVDNYALFAALEQLSDVARSVGNKDLKKYEAMVRQCRPLVGDGRFVSVITRLLGSAEDQLVAAQIQKLLKSEAASAHPRSSLSAPQYGFSRPVFHPYADYSRGRGRGSMSRNRCYSCGRWGHFARACPERR